VEECGPCPVFASFTLAFALQLRKKARKNLSQGKKNLSQVKKNLSQSTVYILPKQCIHITKTFFEWKMETVGSFEKLVNLFLTTGRYNQHNCVFESKYLTNS